MIWSTLIVDSTVQIAAMDEKKVLAEVHGRQGEQVSVSDAGSPGCPGVGTPRSHRRGI